MCKKIVFLLKATDSQNLAKLFFKIKEKLKYADKKHNFYASIQ